MRDIPIMMGRWSFSEMVFFNSGVVYPFQRFNFMMNYRSVMAVVIRATPYPISKHLSTFKIQQKFGSHFFHGSIYMQGFIGSLIGAPSFNNFYITG
jgi:hypothetical protein